MRGEADIEMWWTASDKDGTTALMGAAEKSHVGYVRALLNAGASLGDSPQEQEWIQTRNKELILKAESGDLAQVQSALESEPTFQKLRELGPQILNVPWVILPFIQALKSEIPNLVSRLKNSA